MYVEEIMSLKQALEVRVIRNDCRKFMTNDQSYISVFKQVWWYFFKYKTSNDKCYVLYEKKPIGYGFIHNGFLSLGIIRSYRGKGAGRVLLKFLMESSSKLEVFKKNKRAIKLYRSEGFKTYKRTEKTLLMKT